MGSVDTGHEQRDAHLRTNDFFDVPNYPTMTFRSTEVNKLDDTTFRVTGDLTIKDTTRPVSALTHQKGPRRSVRCLM